MTNEDRKKITDAILAKGGNRPCARCGNQQFTLEGYFSSPVIEDKHTVGALRAGGPVIPSVASICSRCGAMTFHALGALGLLVALGFPGSEQG